MYNNGSEIQEICGWKGEATWQASNRWENNNKMDLQTDCGSGYTVEYQYNEILGTSEINML